MRAARLDEGAEVGRAIEALIRELSGNAEFALTDFDAVFQALCSRPDLGGVLVAIDGGAIVGVLDYSLQMAIRTGGRYAIIQDLWADPALRGAGIGRALIAALREALPADVSRVEVGLAPPTFGEVDRTTAFYARVGFTRMGDRFKAEVERLPQPGRLRVKRSVGSPAASASAAPRTRSRTPSQHRR